MGFWGALAAESELTRTLWLGVFFVISLVLVRALAPLAVRLKALIFFFFAHLLFLFIAAALRAYESDLHDDFRVVSLAFGGMATVGAGAALLFSTLLPKVRIVVPRILQDVMVAIAALVTLLTILSRSGVNLSGLIATSAVATAMIGLSLQDVIANVAGGLALQVDNSIEVGDWVKFGDVNGQVTEIRWRYTAVETRNWETVLVPNSQLMKSSVVVLGRRQGQPRLVRRWVYFNVDYRFSPNDVIDTVLAALRSATLERVATEPTPNCVLMDLSDSYGRYAVRYWLKDFALDDPTDSAVRALIFTALQRHGMRLSIPAQAIFVTEESKDRAVYKKQKELDRREKALRQIELFEPLSNEEKRQLAQGLKFAPFHRGETITKQGSEAHWLYLIEEGEVAIRVSDQGIDKEVAQMRAGSFFGEMALLTGEKRSATVVAQTDVDCWRLDKHVFKEVLEKRPEVADGVARVLQRRRTELLKIREGLDAEAARRRVGSEEDLIDKIQRFFGLKGS